MASSSSSCSACWLADKPSLISAECNHIAWKRARLILEVGDARRRVLAWDLLGKIENVGQGTAPDSPHKDLGLATYTLFRPFTMPPKGKGRGCCKPTAPKDPAEFPICSQEFTKGRDDMQHTCRGAPKMDSLWRTA
ncbi:hypothetical protein B0H14DRAFT_2592167 [Mycena olivaceomarginata]|nr:hypothetical protein B0H14DRAFT_2592167 [Mycena olivaceomarginata]